MDLHATSDVVPIDPGDLKELLTEVRISQNFQVATAVLLVYDTIITFDKEVKYFWVAYPSHLVRSRSRVLTQVIQKIPRRPVDFIYFVNRYIGIFGTVTSFFSESFNATLLFCNLSRWSGNISNWVIIISIDYILMIRVLALYSQGKRLSVCLKTLLALEAVFKLGMVVYLNTVVHIVIAEYADISACAVVSLPPWQLGMIDWVVPLAYGTLLMIMALPKAAEYWRMSAGFKGLALVKVLIEDQILYFALATSCSVFAILNLKVVFSNIFLGIVFSELGNPALLSLLGSRMLFNLKEAGERGQNEGTSYGTSSGTMSTIDFVEAVNPQRESGTERSESEEMA